MIIKLTKIVVLLLVLGAAVILFPKEKKSIVALSSSVAEKKRENLKTIRKIGKVEKVKLKIHGMLLLLDEDKSFFYRLVVFCALAGVGIGLILFGSLFLSICTGIAATPVSYVILMLLTMKETERESEELQTAMGVITNAYKANGNIIKSFEKYCISKREFLTWEETRALAKVSVFDEFVAECSVANPDINSALERLSFKVDNNNFKEWCKVLRLCNEDRSYRYDLEPCVREMSKEKQMKIKADESMRESLLTYFGVMGLTYMVIFLFRTSDKEMYHQLTHTFIGQVLVIALLVASIFSGFIVMRMLSKPVK
jgi:hypothetical protein